MRPLDTVFVTGGHRDATAQTLELELRPLRVLGHEQKKVFILK